MNKQLVIRIVGILLVFLLQVLVCNRIVFWQCATPFVIIYLLLKMPSGVSPYSALTFAFFLGIVTDMFTNTPGLYALALVTAAFVHHYLINAIQYRDRGEESFTPSAAMLGWQGYTIYTTVLTLIFCTVLFCIDSLSFFEPSQLLMRIVGSTVLTTLILLAVEWIYKKRG